MHLQNLKSVALPVPEIIGYPKKFGQPLDMPTLPFLQNLLWAFIRIGLVNVYSPNLMSVALPVPEIIGGAQKFGHPLDKPTLHFLKKFNGLLFGMAM